MFPEQFRPNINMQFLSNLEINLLTVKIENRLSFKWKDIFAWYSFVVANAYLVICNVWTNGQYIIDNNSTYSSYAH